MVHGEQLPDRESGMELKNISRYYPDDMPYGEGVQYFQSEDGQDFYESLDKFTKKYKFCVHPVTGVIHSISEDVSRLFPNGFSVVETDYLPEDFDINTGWYFDENEIKPIPVNYTEKAESKRKELLVEAESRVSNWKTYLSLGIISESDKEKLLNWMLYIQKLESMDFIGITDEQTYNTIEWPVLPDV
ncbi:TPA: tail fiber assembly protein [Salmonella enterica subsp. enterica]|nr:tail fiber assembly protein [Salmonella enterica]HAU7687283.1 tail fiber assembly protein [Salmonella enterica subsp. enterica]